MCHPHAGRDIWTIEDKASFATARTMATEARTTPATDPNDGGNAMGNPLLELQRYGQSVWLDYIRRQSLLSGEVQRLIDDDGLRGMTANPTIFQQAIAAGHDYDDTIDRMLRQDADPNTIYETIADRGHPDGHATSSGPVYDATDGADGFVSLEVAPSLANDTEGTIAEARRLWKTGRPPEPDDQGAGHWRRASRPSRHCWPRGSTST